MTDAPKNMSLTIDTHHQILPDFFWQATENAHAPVGGLAPLRWSKEASISFMDDAGIDVAVVSLGTPGVHTGDSAKARALARRCNEFSAELVHVKPDRFGGFSLSIFGLVTKLTMQACEGRRIQYQFFPHLKIKLIDCTLYNNKEDLKQHFLSVAIPK
jgi:hypothetical protein